MNLDFVPFFFFFLFFFLMKIKIKQAACVQWFVRPVVW